MPKLRRLLIDVGVTLECVATWSRDVNRTYVITRQVDTHRVACYVSILIIVREFEFYEF